MLKKCELVRGFPTQVIKLAFVQCDVALASFRQFVFPLPLGFRDNPSGVQRYGLTGSSVDASVPSPRGDVPVLMGSCVRPFAFVDETFSIAH